MKMRKIATLCCLVLCAIAAAGASSRADDALRTLGKELDNRQGYIAARQARIDSLGHVLAARPDDAALLLAMADAYKGFNNDSTLYYLNRGVEVSDGAERLRFRWYRSSLLPLAGFFSEAQDDFGTIDPDSVPPSRLAQYYDAGRQLYSYLAAFFTNTPEYRKRYTEKVLGFQEKLIGQLDPASDEYKFNLGEYYFLTGSDVKAKVLLQEVLDNVAPDSPLAARAAHHLAVIAERAGDTGDYVYFLALSAIVDARSATREVASLQQLGELQYSLGEVDRAHRLLSVAVENAVECGAPLRTIESAKSLPIIERAHARNLARWHRSLYWIMAGLGFLLLVLVATMLILRREMKHMARLQTKLRAANYAKEVYISRFLQLCSIYMDKLNQFCKISARKIAAGQTDELYRMVKSGKFVEEQSNEFYQVFDSAFLHIYPTFVEEVNKLLLPGKEIEVKEDGMLNTELRILAFMRLGIEESARIAQVLNYSLNTIYAYRNRLKGRARSRDTFESDIMKIDSAV